MRSLLLTTLLLTACGESPEPAGPVELPEAERLDAAPALRNAELEPERADTVGGSEGGLQGLIQQADLDEELASTLDALDQAEGDENANVLTFAKLSLARADYSLLLDHLFPDPAREGDLPPYAFPEKVAALDGQEIELLGYMIPTEYVDTMVKEFMFVRDTGACCYGGIPRPDEWALVTVQPEEGFEYHPYLPLVVKGTFHLLAPGADPDLPMVYAMDGLELRRYY